MASADGQYVVPKSNLWCSPTNVFPAAPLETHRGGKHVFRDVTPKTLIYAQNWTVVRQLDERSGNSMCFMFIGGLSSNFNCL